MLTIADALQLLAFAGTCLVAGAEGRPCSWRSSNCAASARPDSSYETLTETVAGFLCHAPACGSVEKIWAVDFGSGVTHVAFADEAYRDTGRFRSVASISLPVSNYEFINSAILDLNDSDSELKWSKVKNEDKARGVPSVYRRVI
ncbi:MAG: hypothetical protein OXG07_02605 [Anaerolineaceae bacterium]|nr:hypothetical protein [Anaerolineaceae bacterium]